MGRSWRDLIGVLLLEVAGALTEALEVGLDVVLALKQL